MNETRTLRQRCEALGQFEDYKDDHVEMKFSDGRWLLESDGFVLAFIYPDRVNGSEWLADAILYHIERIRFGIKDSKSYCQEDLNRAGVRNICKPITGDVPTIVVPTEISDIECQRFIESLTQSREGMIDRLPDVTYVVEAPKPTEPTQEQLKAIWDHVMHLTGEQAESYGFQYAVIGNAAQANFELHIKSLGSRFGEWQIKIMHGHIGRYWWENPFDLVTTARLINMAITIPTEQYVTESPLQFVSIPVQDWQEVLEAFMSLGKVLNSHTA